MATDDTLERARQAYERRAWLEAAELLAEADRRSALAPGDLEWLATSAYLAGEQELSEDAWTRAHRAFHEAGEERRAVRCAFWLGWALVNTGDMAQAGGWFARAKRLLDRIEDDCPERTYLLVPAAIQTLEGGDPEGALALFTDVAEAGARFGDPDLTTLGLLGRGDALVRTGAVAEGMSCMDEAMVAVAADEVSPMVTGTVYCAVIIACRQVFDLRRAQEWTSALADWCRGQPQLAMYRGQCMVHRSEILQLKGAWEEAVEEARLACERLATPPQPAIGTAHYQRGELHRLRGELSEAEDAYTQASRCGRDPQPGFAQLRLAQGRIDAAKAAIQRASEEAASPGDRSEVLSACVEIMLAAGDVEHARRAANELAEHADELGAPFLAALSAQNAGAVLLAEAKPGAALDQLRRAFNGWQNLDAPYELARTRVLIGLACRDLGDEDSAILEIEAARDALVDLGARPDVERIERLLAEDTGPATGLTSREIEVLGLVAAGKTNRQIASDLVISQKTVDRHMSNIFAKIGVSSRAAATAYAYEHELV